MDLSVIIPTHNRNDQLVLLLDSLMKQDLQGLQIEVIVAGNIYDSKLKSYIDSLENSNIQFSYHSSGKIGVNTARNLGLRVSQSQKIYFLDDDVLLENPTHLKLVFDLATTHSEIAAIGGSYHLPEKARIIDEVYHAICTSWQSDAESVHLVGGNTIYNKEVLKEYLKFNEDIIFGGSETEMNLRLHTLGFKFLFNKSLNIKHSTHLNLFDLSTKAIRQGMGRHRHEGLVAKSYWQSGQSDPKAFFKSTSSSALTYLIVRSYMAIYDFFFHVGYRHGLRQKDGPLSRMAIILCAFQTFFQIDADKVLFINDSKSEPFHLKNYPTLKFRELHHWLKGNIWWKIPYFIIWKISNFIIWRIVPIIGIITVCAIGSFFPFNTIGLRVPYNKAFNDFENLIKNKRID